MLRMDRFVTAMKKATTAPALNCPVNAPLNALPNTSNMAKPVRTAVNSAGTSLTASTATLANSAKQNQNTPSKKAAIKRRSLRSPEAELEQIAVLGPAVTAGWAPTKAVEECSDGKYPPAKPGALLCEPLKAAERGR